MARYVELEISIFADGVFGNAPGMLFVLVEDFGGAFSSSSKCSVMPLGTGRSSGKFCGAVYGSD